MYRFAFRGRWLIGQVVVLAIAALFVWLGFWQLHKAQATASRNATIRTREAMQPEEFGALLARGGTGDYALFRRATVSGRYDPAVQFVVLYRSIDEQPGAYLLTPLVTSDGTVVIVNRGWFPSQDAQPPVPPGSEPPSGEVRVTGLLLPSEGRTRVSASAIAGGPIELTSVDLPALRASVPSAVYSVYLQLQDQDPVQPPGVTALPPPALSAGPYFSYAVQWFLFTAVGLIGWPLLVRRASRERAARSTAA